MGSMGHTMNRTAEELIGHIGFSKPVVVDKKANKKVLVVGANSYIGISFAKYAREHYMHNLQIDFVSSRISSNGKAEWETKAFSQYDIVFHVAGIAHRSDVLEADYYKVNTDLAIAVAKKAKIEHVQEFVFMSSMSLYGDSTAYNVDKIIDEHTIPSPTSPYGDSKLQADVALREMADANFKVLVLRPPMIYGKNCKGNYPKLAKIAKSAPIFPDIDNRRSMLYIENFCEFLCQIMLVRAPEPNAIVLFPQDQAYVKTSKMVQLIAENAHHHICTSRIWNIGVILTNILPKRFKILANKAFGNNCYKMDLSEYQGIEYQTINFQDSIRRTEC